MVINFQEVYDIKIYGEQEILGADVRATVSLFILNQNLDGTDQLALKAEIDDVEANLTMLVGQQTPEEGGHPILWPEIKDIYAHELRITTCTWGTVNSELFQIAFNVLMGPGAALRILANKSLATEILIELPANILYGTFSLTDLTIRWYDNYVMFGLTPGFNAIRAITLFPDWS